MPPTWAIFLVPPCGLCRIGVCRAIDYLFEGHQLHVLISHYKTMTTTQIGVIMQSMNWYDSLDATQHNALDCYG
jgi:hypothetical protein